MKHLIQLLVILAVLNALGLAGLWYGVSVMKNKKDTETQLRASIAEEGQKGNKLAVLRRSLILAEKDRAAFSKYFTDPSEESQINFVTEIEQLGTTTGAMVKTETFEVSSQEPKSFRATFSLIGSWGELYHTLRLIEEYPGRISIRRFDARQNPPDNDHKLPYWGGSLSMELTSIKSSQ